ncbi:hypothetical protein FIBSPDRAFT_1046656 [Athelia psychrophila]|uniref:DUF6533 domain-containing protein n=1 Tax=Athelia psychrophila TaxID=1759441 RepID=A0A166GAE0_9AGAM|nr:hypothetical protein FIBSPDRAFT_1046656 [Fibularhizoctonia sp. CBS 109695]
MSGLILETPACIYVATLAALVWDWLLSISEECSVVHRSGFNLATVTYFVSRFSTLGNCIAGLVFIVAPISQCMTVVHVSAGLWEVAMPATAFLFLLRVRAVFHDSKPTRIFFGVFWVAVLGTSTLKIVSIVSARPSPFGCILTSRSSAAIAAIVPAVFDTFVFLAISWRIVFRAAAIGTTLRARLQGFFSGRGLKVLQKAILHGGQAYYLVTMLVAIMCLASYGNSPAAVGMRYLFGPPYLVVSNLMACHVFRAMMLHDMSDDEGHTVEMTTLHQEAVDSHVVSPTLKGSTPSQIKPTDGDRQQIFDPSSPPDIV